MADRSEALRTAAKARHDAATARAEAALESFRRQGRPVSFGQLAKTAGVARSWLYRQPELREKVERLRGEPPRKSSRDAQRASADSLRQQLHVYREELARARSENASLKEQLARQLGAARAASVTRIS